MFSEILRDLRAKKRFSQKQLAEIVGENTDKTAQTVNILLNYGGRSELARAARLAAKSGEVTEASTRVSA